MHLSSPGRLFLLLLCLLVTLSSCSAPKVLTPDSGQLAYAVNDAGDRLHRFAPVLITEQGTAAHNRIGTVRAQISPDGTETVLVDPAQATLYAEERSWKGQQGSFTNLIYRIHFPEVPFSFIPFYLGAGNNVGLLVIITLDSRERPLLYTTLHTCGCYLAFVPTDNLPDSAYPPDWPHNATSQPVYGETLPLIIQHANAEDDHSLFLLLREATHRVGHLWLASRSALSGYLVEPAVIKPMSSLERLPLDNGTTTSMFETNGSREGYVKGSHKIWERLLIGWWALDWRVGEDKMLGADRTDGTVFYTSLKPWAREESDLRDFSAFLEYWQWRL